MRKIHCIDLKEDSSFDEIREFIGWIEPPEKEGGTWDVTMVEGYFACKDQATAQIIASIEEVKALILSIKHMEVKMAEDEQTTPQETTEETSETPEETTEKTEEESENESEESSEEDSETKEE